MECGVFRRVTEGEMTVGREEDGEGKRARRNNQGWQVGGTRTEKGLVDYSSS